MEEPASEEDMSNLLYASTGSRLVPMTFMIKVDSKVSEIAYTSTCLRTITMPCACETYDRFIEIIVGMEVRLDGKSFNII